MKMKHDEGNRRKRRKGESSKAKKQKTSSQLVPPMMTMTNWSQLPTTAVLDIYKYLGDIDRVAMAKVCRPWHQVFRNPVLWRRRVVEFGPGRSKRAIEMDELYKSQTALPLASGKSAIRFAEKFPTYLQELDIFVKLTFPVPKVIVGDFMRFSELLDNSNLLKIKITYCLFDLLGSEGQHNFLKPLKRLLKYQHSLKEVGICSTLLLMDEGLKLLSSLASASGDSIEILSLNEFFQYTTSFHLDGREVKAMERFPQLCQIHIDYQILSDGMVRLWARGFPSLTYIKLWAHTPGNSAPYSPGRAISSEAWKELVATHPALLVELCVHILGNMEEMLVILSPSMPVSKLVWDLEMGVATELQLTDFLLRVSNYQNTIKHLFAMVRGKCDNIEDTSVQNILSNCTHLLPYTCRYLKDPERDTNTWFLSQCGS